MKRFLKRFMLYGTALWLINMMLGEILKTVKRDLIETGAYFPKYRWEEYYKNEKGSIDVLVLGSSHAYRGINPFVIDSLLNCKSFNLGSSGQSIQTAYYVLLNALRTQSPKAVVLEIYFYAFFEHEQLKNGGYNFDYMEWSREKVDFLFHGFNMAERLTILLMPSIRYKSGLIYLMKKILGASNLPDRGSYIGKGFVQSTKKINELSLSAVNHFDNFRFDPSYIDPNDIEYLHKFRRLCDSNNIELYWVTAPIPSKTYNKILGIETVHSFFRLKSLALGIPYYDYLSGTKLGLVDTLHFMDSNHLNLEGSRIFTTRIANDVRNLK